MKNKNILISIVLAFIMAFLELSGLPAALFINIEILDIDSMYFILMANFLIAFVICRLFAKFLLKDWNWGLQFHDIWKGLRRYGLPAMISTIIVTISFCVGLSPFNNIPTIWRVLVEGIIYYVGVSIVEELYLRGLLQNIIEKCFEDRKISALLAVILTSIIFGIGHILGSSEQPVITVIAKVIWATALGIYFGAVYVKTRNLWVPIVLHFVIDLCGIPFCFSNVNEYPQISVMMSLVCYMVLGIYGIFILKKEIYVEEKQ